MYRRFYPVFAAGILLAHPALAGEVQKEIEIASGGSVSIRLGSGEIKVATWDKPTVSLNATVSSSANDLDATSDKGNVSIGFGHKNGAGGDAGRADSVAHPAKCLVGLALGFLAVRVAAWCLHVAGHAVHLEVENEAGNDCGPASRCCDDASGAQT